MIRKRVILSLLCAWVGIAAASAAIRDVPGTYPQISQAIAAANSGDIIEIQAGTYTGTLVVSGKSLTIRGVGGLAVIDLSTKSDTDPILTIANCTVTLEDLRLTGGGQNAFVPAGGALKLDNATVVATGCTFDHNQADEGGAIYVGAGSDFTLVASTVEDNSAYASGGGIYADDALVDIDDTTFTSNTAFLGGALALLASGGIGATPSTIDHCDFVTNASYDIYAVAKLELRDSTFAAAINSGVFTNSGHLLVEDCEFTAGQQDPYVLIDPDPVYPVPATPPTLRRCLFRGHPLIALKCDVDADIEQCRFVENGIAVEHAESGDMYFENCLFLRNGVGVLSWSDIRTGFQSVTFAYNDRPFMLYREGAMLNAAVNCIVWGNARRPLIASDFAAAYCFVEGGLAGFELDKPDVELFWSTEFNYVEDPLLTPHGMLTQASPARGVGFAPSVDIHGETRSGGDDIGCDQFVDGDIDGLPDWFELEYFGSTTAAVPTGDSEPIGRYNNTDTLLNIEEYEKYGSNPVRRPIYVDNDLGSDGNSGGSWRSAKRTIQAAINIAQDGDTIMIGSSRGTYNGIGNYDLDFGDKTLVLRGSVATFPAIEYTYVDANGNGNLIDDFAGNVSLLNLRMREGAASGGLAGAGLVSDGGRLLVEDCTVSNNTGLLGYDGLLALRTPIAFDGTTFSSHTGDAFVGEFASIALLGDVQFNADEQVELVDARITGPGALRLSPGSVLTIAASGPIAGAAAGPTEIDSDVRGPGDVLVALGAELILGGDAVMNLSSLPDDVCGVTAGAPSEGTLIVEGNVVVQDTATIVNTAVEVKLAEFNGGNDILLNDITLREASPGFGGELFVTDAAQIACNRITSEGDRYLDLDPDSGAAQRPTITNNEITVHIIEGQLGDQGTLLELRGEDFDCNTPTNPNCGSGLFLAPTSPGFTADPSANWVLEKLEIMPGAKVTLTNRPGFEYVASDHPEALYVKDIVLHPGATLSTGLQAAYYQTLTDPNGVPLDPNAPHNGAMIIDEPLLGFSLVNIAMEDDTEFDVRVRTRVRDPNDIQPCECFGDCDQPTDPQLLFCYEGAIQRIDHPTHGGVMEMSTQAPSRQPASSVAAKGAFARAGDEDITITFDYLFQADPSAEIHVYLSDAPDVDDNLVLVDVVTPPAAGRPGAIGSSDFGIYHRTVPRGGLNLVRGTYVQLELRGGPSASLLVDNFDPQILCGYVCADADGSLPRRAGVNAIDYLLLVAEAGQNPGDGSRWCLDLTGDGYVDLADVLRWDAFFSGDLLGCGSLALAPQQAAPRPPVTLPTSGLLLAGKPTSATGGVRPDRLFHTHADGTCPTGNTYDPVGGSDSLNNGVLAVAAQGDVYQASADLGIAHVADGQVLVPPQQWNLTGGATARLGVVPGEFDIAPIDDFAFDPVDPNVVYVTPLMIQQTDGTIYAAAGRLRVVNPGGAALLEAVFGEPDDPGSDVRLAHPREIAVDAAGTRVFVATGYATRGTDAALLINDYLLAFGASSSGPPQSVLDLHTLNPPLNGPVGLTVVGAAGDPGYVYLAAGVNELDDAPDAHRTRLYRFVQQSSAPPTFDGVIEIDWPVDAASDAGFGFTAAVHAIAADATTGDLHVIGVTAPFYPADYPSTAPPFDNPNADLFTTAGQATIPTGTAWASAPGLAPVISAAALDPCGGLALPISAVYLGGADVPGDLDDDGVVDAADLGLFVDCLDGPVAPVDAGCDDADFVEDMHVDVRDYAAFQHLVGG